MRLILFLILSAALWAQNPVSRECKIADAGGDDTYAGTCVSGVTRVMLTASTANTGAATLSTDGGTTPVAIYCGGTTNCPDGTIPAGRPVLLELQSGAWQVLSGGGGSGSSLPDQSGHANAILTTDASTASWADMEAGDLITVSVGGGAITISGDTAALTQYSLSSSAPTGACDPVAFVSVTGGDLYACVAGAWVQLAPNSHAHAASAITSGTLDAARLPLPTSSTLGGVQATSNPGGQFVNGINASTGALEYGSVGSGYGSMIWASGNAPLTTTTLPASTAKWFSTGSFQNGISGAYIIAPASGTLRDLWVYCTGSQGRDAAIEFELYKAPATATGVKVTIANGSATNYYSDTTNTYSLTAGDAFSLRLWTTSTTGTGCTFAGWSARIQ